MQEFANQENNTSQEEYLQSNSFSEEQNFVKINNYKKFVVFGLKLQQNCLFYRKW